VVTTTRRSVRLVPLTTKLSDEQLAASAAAGSMAALEELFHRYEKPVVRYLTRMISDHEEALDLFQETFLRAHDNLARYDPRRPFRAWFYRIATNLALDHVRKVARRVAPPEPEPDCLSVVSTATDTVLSEQVQTVVARLSEEQRTVFILRHYQGLSYAEIAEVCGSLEGTVRSRMHYAIRALREKLQFLVEEDDVL